MQKIIIRSSLLILILLLYKSGFQAQTQKGDLILDKLITSEIAPTDVHRYKISLDQDQFAFFKLMQKGVDVKISTFDPDGNKLEDFDSPNGKNGPELFTLKSSKKGSYIVEVSPFDEKEPNGLYELAVKQIKAKATTPNEQVDELFAPWDDDTSPGAAVAIVKGGKVIYKKGYGMANLEYYIPITPSSIFHIASVSKQFTVFSILLLESEGKLSLDDDIRKYIPEVPDFGKLITLRHLASHTSGMRDQWNLLSMAGWRMDDVITKEHVLKLVSKQKELNFDPGEEFAYCNTGFTLLAEVVSRVSDMTFSEFTKKRIFEPLKMGNTQFYDDHEKIVKNRAYSYYSTDGGYKKSVLNYANVGATSLFTTVEDLSLWALNFSEMKVGNAAIIEKMNTPAVLNNGETFGGALGQFVGEYKGLNEIQHGGADAGYRSYLSRFPDEGFSVSVFSNAAEFNPGALAHKVVDIYLKDKLTPEEKKENKMDEGSSEEIVISSETTKSYVGEFELQPGFTITVMEKEESLFAKATGQPEVSLTPLSQTEFKVSGVEAKLEFIPNNGEKVKLIKLHQGGQIMEALRMGSFDKTAVKLEDYEGDFFSEELSTTYNVVLEEGQLLVKHSRLSDFKLNPSKEDVFSGEAWYFGLVEFVRGTDKEIIGFKVSNGRVRNLYFQRAK